MSTQTALIPDHDPAPPVQDLGASEPKKKKHKPGSLRRALSWLRGRKKKKPEVKQEGKDNSKLDAQVTPPQADDSPDNVFFPSGRTSVVEEIHSQAQEGLKSLQRREKHQGKHSFQDENTPPEPTPETNDSAFRVRSLSYTTENTDDALFVRSEMIQRKGSTFRPYDSPRTPTNRVGRKRKEKRATVVGVPQHIATELGLKPSSTHRGIHELFRRENGQLLEKKSAEIPVANWVQGPEGEFVVIPTVDGKPASMPHDGAHISLAVLEQTEAALQRHINKVYHDDSCIGWKSGSKLSPLVLRPKSLAVPGMTTHSPQSDPVSPVMSISPQATYMSKIIPNAILPPLVDVVALSRSSVRTLSRCSLATASPASIRGSLHRGRGMSSSSDNWSRSQSTETIVSDSSTISSRGGDNTLEANEKSGLSTGRASPAPSTGTQDGSDAASLCSGRSSVRSVSLRKSKKAPPPPIRTYSLQQQKELGLPPRPDKKPSSKTGHGKDPWVLRTDKVSSDNDVFLPTLAGPKQNSPSRSDRTMSPSSGYSSQSGTPTMPVRSLLESPSSRRKTPPKPERSSLKSATNMSVSSTSPVEDTSTVLVSPARAGSSMGYQEGQDLIPPHPSVPAPFCPPPTSASDPLVTTVTPPPSPPAHHPTPPPSRKSESDSDITQSVKEVAQKETLWPPPPPETSDVQDLSMADFPPPDDELFLPSPPFGELVTERPSSEQVSVKADDKSDTPKAEMPLTASNNMEYLTVVAALQPELVPLNAKPSEHALVIENNSAPVPPLDTEHTDLIVPPSSESTVEPPVTSNTEFANGEAFMMYKPHFNRASTTSSEPKETLLVIVPQESTEKLSLTTIEPKNTTTTSSVTTVPSTMVESSVPKVPSSVAVTSPVFSKAVISPLSKSSSWKPVTAPVTKKESVTSQSTVVAQKEDANLPIVTPSLLQMVRLRSIQARVPQSPYSQPLPGLPAPQKPVRKSLSQKSPQGSDSSPVESPTAPPASPQKPPESPSAHRSSASAASFVFARSSKKFVFDPPTSQDAESSLKKDLVAELKTHGGPRSPDEKPPIQRKPSKIPPPVARKPSVGVPRTPTSPPSSTGGTNGSVFTPRDTELAPSTTAAVTSGTQAGQNQQQKSQTEQA
ncbi:NHS-like protein 3 isoform X2 [Phyllobates terribilis]|uniref:NHS-like protein 3 isoform X2 n=1 Tax=Phyllobates terribilis TaxID=111132 RepID=UPI003CCA7F2F